MSEHHGKVWWNELMTRDVAASTKYYCDIMGWTVETAPMDFGDYHLFMNGETIVGGAMQMPPDMDGVPDHWMTYLAVSDVDAAAKATTDAGGRVLNGPFDVDGVGRIAIIADVTGAAVGLMTPAESAPS